ncbi:aminoglycoside phosphotransferase family protein [Nocardia sp. NPDC004860]|uniref:phosphotransferase family protein n=1 Tax=Nocardia sp. NPDC004860 TaxID=3154557 RepID=UPI0033A05E46
MRSDAAAAEATIESARHFLVEQGLAAPGEHATWTPLTGGVSSLLWKVDLEHTTVCVKGALRQLKVAGTWLAPVTRNTVEWNWLEYAADVVRGHVPEPLAHDADRGMFAMSFLAPEDHPVWKGRLFAGLIDPREAAAVGDLVGTLHSASANSQDLAHRFDADDNFHALRIEPYLVSTARRHQDLGSRFDDIIDRTTETHLAVVHGDVSPKNILIGPRGPVLLDAECAWYGDPAFDLAFVVNHLVIKTLVAAHDDQKRSLLDSAYALVHAYADRVTWEPADVTLERAALLLPALLLARIDGLSPVDYLDEEQRATAREVARRLVQRGGRDLDATIGNAAESFAASGRFDGSF